MNVSASFALNRPLSPVQGSAMHMSSPKSALSLRSRLRFVTLSGVDGATPFDGLCELARRYPYAEFGVLYSKGQVGTGRYPPRKWIESLAHRARTVPGLNLSLHVCGEAIGDLMMGKDHVSELALLFPRVQANFLAEGRALISVRKLLKRLPHTTIITQHTEASESLWRDLAERPNRAVMFNTSGRKGLGSLRWQAPLKKIESGWSFKAIDPLCGYAGGLGPDNVERNLRLIADLTRHSAFWLEMESKLLGRAARFDISRAQKCLDAVERVLLNDDMGADAAALPVRNFPTMAGAQISVIPVAA